MIGFRFRKFKVYQDAIEFIACLDIALKENYITPKIHENYLKEAEDLVNQITAFRRKLLTSPTK